MRQRNPRLRRAGQGGGHARHDPNLHPGGHQGFRLLAATAEDERVAALQPHHAGMAMRQPHQQFVDLLLRQAMVGPALADIDPLGRGIGQRQDLLAHQPVMHDHVRLLQQPHGAQCQQIDRTGAGANQMNNAGGGLGTMHHTISNG